MTRLGALVALGVAVGAGAKSENKKSTRTKGRTIGEIVGSARSATATENRSKKGRGKDTEVFSFQVRRRSEASSRCVSHSWARLGAPRPPKKNASAAQAGTRATWSARTRQAFARPGSREAGTPPPSGRRAR